MNHLYFGDCLDILLELDREHNGKGFIDLIYIDPPFNSKRNYNVLFESIDLKDANAQKQAFADTWSNVSYMDEKNQLDVKNKDLFEFLQALDHIRSFSRSAVSYLTIMAHRIYYMHRLLKDTGSFYLHCDSTMSHYLKLICDMIFGEKNFRNEIIWKRKTGRGETNQKSNRFGNCTDIILFYAKTEKNKMNPQFNDEAVGYKEYLESSFKFIDEDGRKYMSDNLASPTPRPNLTYEYKGYKPPKTGWAISKEKMSEWDKEGRLIFPEDKNGRIRRKRYLDEVKGRPVQNLWDDIGMISSQAQERLGYPTQKPEALLERIINASSNEGDLVADFFCGCGTTIAAAHKLKRNWIGADISHLAVRLILKRLIDSYGQGVKHNIKLHGLPKDVASARMLAEETDKGRFNFQDWVIEVLLNGVHNPKKTADGGYDGYLTFELPEKKEFVLIEVKSGNVNLNQFKSFIKTVQDEKAAIGVFVCFEVQVTKEMERQAKQSGYYNEKFWDKSYPTVQILTIEQLLNNQQPKFPASRKGTFKSAQRKATDVTSKGMFD